MRRFFVAVVGAGPSGFFAASALLDPSAGAEVRVDMLEMLPTPWGLVRPGVAPDHPKIKSISARFAATAADPRFRFFGNVAVGNPAAGGGVSAAELADRYDAVVYAVGAQADRPLGIPGEDLPGSVAATDFVGWYNAHPLAHPDLGVGGADGSRRAVVIGNGNVALDVARILVSDPAELAATDIADGALASLRRGGVDEVVIIGRRGPLQAPFTTLELRELGALPGVDIVVDPADLAGVTDAAVAAAGKTVAQNVKVLRGYAEHGATGARRRIVFRFWMSPIEIRGTDRVTSVVLGVNRMVDGDTRAADTGAREELPVHLVVRAVGYRGVAVAGLPFDERTATIPQADGRIEGRRNEYVVGWIKRGPSGVIGTNKRDAQETVATVLASLKGAAQHAESADDRGAALADWLRKRTPGIVDDDQWHLIDDHELAAGRRAGRPRVKVADVAEMLAIGRREVSPEPEG